jgi:hypothetical protein
MSRNGNLPATHIVSNSTENRGYFIGAAPKDQPSLVSRHLTVKYNALICRLAFPAGEHVSMPDKPQVHLINDYGDFKLKASRVAAVDGDEDPWCARHVFIDGGMLIFEQDLRYFAFACC